MPLRRYHSTSFQNTCLFHNTFKTNPYLERGLLTDITRVSKESVFSDLNNLELATTTSEKYATAFGFTEKEVFDALEEYGIENQKDAVSQWYDRFIFEGHGNIYNPWSIVNFLTVYIFAIRTPESGSKPS